MIAGRLRKKVAVSVSAGFGSMCTAELVGARDVLGDLSGLSVYWLRGIGLPI